MDFTDETNGITAYYEIGNGGVKSNPKDYLKGEIVRTASGEKLSQIFGTYMGYLDIDGERRWDIRKQVNYLPRDLNKAELATSPNGKMPLVLPSDTTYRLDSLTLEEGDVEAAQLRKNEMEEAQRHDRKLREAAEKRRNEGGPKISYEPYQK